MHRLTRDAPTTLTKDGELASKLPIDQCYGNQSALDWGLRVKVDTTLRISDRLPILLQATVRESVTWRVTWARPTKNLPPRIHDIPWVAAPVSFEQWQIAACDCMIHSLRVVYKLPKSHHLGGV